MHNPHGQFYWNLIFFEILKWFFKKIYMSKNMFTFTIIVNFLEVFTSWWLLIFYYYIIWNSVSLFGVFFWASKLDLFLESSNMVRWSYLWSGPYETEAFKEYTSFYSYVTLRQIWFCSMPGTKSGFIIDLNYEVVLRLRVEMEYSSLYYI